jgi:hypothetical protein
MKRGSNPPSNIMARKKGKQKVELKTVVFSSAGITCGQVVGNYQSHILHQHRRQAWLFTITRYIMQIL